MTKTVTATLTDFLLARIAEDEERIVHEFDCDRLQVYDYGTRYGDCDCAAMSRLRAECEAKRSIVELHRSWDENEWQSPPYFSAPMDEVLAALALPYADHPDYRDEWRP